MKRDDGILNGKVAIVTGWAGKLGAFIAQEFAAEGAKLWLVDSSETESSKLMIKELGSSVLGSVTLDIADENAVSKFFMEQVSRYPLDILVNNAGVGVFSDWRVRTLSEFSRVMAVNAGGSFLMMREAILQMEARRAGSVVNIGSIYGSISSDPRIYGGTPRKNSEAYSASKAAVAQLSRYFAVHASPSGVRVNTVSPGGLSSLEHENYFEKEYVLRTPLGRFAEPADVVPLVTFLASDFSRFITGQNIHVDGGFTTW